MAEFDEARAALLRAVRKVFPGAKQAPGWAGIEAWVAPRPAAAVDEGAGGTIDPKVTLIGIADRKSGPVVYFLDPGDPFILETEKSLLTAAGFKLGRGCIMHTRKAPLPAEALEELFRRVKARDAARAKGQKSRARAPAEPVDRYLAALPGPQRLALERLRKAIRQAAPQATERIAYGMPTFVHAGTNLVHIAAFKDHCSFFPGSGTLTKLLADELAGFDTRKGTIRFAPSKPLPVALVKRIVKLRVAENEALAAKRAAKRAPPRGGGNTSAKKAAKKPPPAEPTSARRRAPDARRREGAASRG